MTVLVLGSTGQLAQHLKEVLPAATFWGRAEADLNEPRGLVEAVRRIEPSAIVIAAAYTAVDRAESEPHIAWRVNADAPAILSAVAASLNIELIHVSTDYVFDGDSDRPYREDDPVRPLSVYGATKLAGELAVRSIAPKHYILRTSWVFSEHGANFVKTMLRLGRERDNLRVVEDQHGRPTYAGDLAQLIGALIAPASGSSLPFGTYHAGGGPATTWCEFARAIMAKAHALAKLSRIPAVQGIPTSDYPTAARRPLRSVLQPNPLLEQSGVRFDWHAGLDRTLRAL